MKIVTVSRRVVDVCTLGIINVISAMDPVLFNVIKRENGLSSPNVKGPVKHFTMIVLTVSKSVFL